MAQEAPSSVPPHTIAIPPAPKAQENQAEIAAHAPGQVQVIRRNGKVTHFDPNKIMVAMTKAFLAVEGGSAAASSRIHDTVQDPHRPGGHRPDPAPARRRHRAHRGHPGPGRAGPDARRRAQGRPRLRALPGEAGPRSAPRRPPPSPSEEHRINVTLADGSTRPLDLARLHTPGDRGLPRAWTRRRRPGHPGRQPAATCSTASRRRTWARPWS